MLPPRKVLATYCVLAQVFVESLNASCWRGRDKDLLPECRSAKQLHFKKEAGCEKEVVCESIARHRAHDKKERTMATSGNGPEQRIALR
jgi:hypothetical protein